MNASDQQHQRERPGGSRRLDARTMLADTEQYILIHPGAGRRERQQCGDARLAAIAGHEELTADERARLTEACYEDAPGAQYALAIQFYRRGRAVQPKGHLQLTANRGKLSPTRVELDGRKERVEVQYTAPDETVQVSIRAFLPGFRRGKVHLHLE
jgi:hypothetical protein